MKTMTAERNSLTRRAFAKRAAVATAAFQVVPGHVLGLNGQTPPSDKVNVAGIGVGGMGRNNIKMCSEVANITALCDIDINYAARAFKAHPSAKTYTDYREMLEKQRDIDAIVVATPDHTHAAIAMACMRAGKHVYVQKPMAYSVGETRALTEAAQKYKVITQMGNQGRSGDGVRMVCEWIWAGAIGTVREVHAWTNRPVWPQGIEIERPKETPPVPAGFDWEKWIGPAPMRPYHPCYHPDSWRAWCDFGTGSLGDLGCHVLDCVYWALRLKYPTSVEANISTYWEGFWKNTEPKHEQFPRSSIVRYTFPEREGLPAVNLTWWDGGLQPPRPAELEEGREMGDSDGGVLFIGDEGKLMCGCYGRSPRLIPESRMKAFKRPAQTLERIPGGEAGHEKNWIQAIREGKQAISNFDYAGPFAEMVLLGNLAVRFPYRRLLWSGENMRVTNDSDAQAYVMRKYHNNWSL